MAHRLLLAFILFTMAICGETKLAPNSAGASGAHQLEVMAPPSESLVSRLMRASQAPLPQPQLVWQRLQFPLLPPPRIGFALTLDSTNKTALLFGGYSSTAGDLNDLWSTDGYQWRQSTSPRNPIERSGANLVYDEARQEALLFGGAHDYEVLGSTWTYTPYAWRQQLPRISPPPRTGACVAYDAARNVTILFGGRYPSDAASYSLNDMWIWDGANWQQQFPATLPYTRSDANMVYDRAREKIVLFGGGVGGGLLDDTWIWDGTTWVQQHPLHQPPGRANFGMAYDEGRQQVILWGGQVSDDRATETWAWDGHDWTQLQTYLEPPREMAYSAQLTYLPELKTVVLVGDFRKKTCVDSGCTNSEETQVWALTYQYLNYLPAISR